MGSLKLFPGMSQAVFEAILHAPDWAEGMAASLRCGIAALAPEARGVCVFLGDMPLVPVGLCAGLAQAASEAGYAARPLPQAAEAGAAADAHDAQALRQQQAQQSLQRDFASELTQAINRLWLGALR